MKTQTYRPRFFWANPKLSWASATLAFLLLVEPGGLQLASAQQKPKWRIKNRLQVSYEFDDNVRETPSDTLTRLHDSSLRFLFNSRAVRTTPRSSLIFTYRGGLQIYFQTEIDNKLINEFDFTTGLKTGNFVVGLRSSGRLKLYLNDQLDYVTGSFEPYLRLPPFLNLGNEIAVGVSGLNYQNFSPFDYSEKRVRWTVSKKLTTRLRSQLELSGKQVRYDRGIIQFGALDNTTTVLTETQADDSYRILFKLNYTKSFLVDLNYSFQHNSSNSFGYAYNKHQIVLVLGFPLAQSLWLRGYGAFQVKNYTDEFSPIFPIDLDTEREQSNFFILDVSKDWNRNLSTLLRFAFYDNESVVRNLFYRKNIITLGFDYRF